MTNREIITKAIEKAVSNGWSGDDLLFINDDGEIDWLHSANPSSASMRLKMYSHDFAKAFWGEYCNFCTEINIKQAPGVIVPDHKHNPGWQYHLQQMVLEEDPINYLSKFI